MFEISRLCLTSMILVSLLWSFPNPPFLFTSPSLLSTPSTIKDIRQIEQTLREIEGNLHPQLSPTALKLQSRLEDFKGEFPPPGDPFWNEFRALVAEQERIENPIVGWANEQYPEISNTEKGGPEPAF